MVRDVSDSLVDKEEGYDSFGLLVYRKYYDLDGKPHGRETFWGEDHRVYRTREWIHGLLDGFDTIYNNGMRHIAVEYVKGEAVNLIGFCPTTGEEIYRSAATEEGRYDVQDPFTRCPAGHRNLFTWRPKGFNNMADP